MNTTSNSFAGKFERSEKVHYPEKEHNVFIQCKNDVNRTIHELQRLVIDKWSGSFDVTNLLPYTNYRCAACETWNNTDCLPNRWYWITTNQSGTYLYT